MELPKLEVSNLSQYVLTLELSNLEYDYGRNPCIPFFGEASISCQYSEFSKYLLLIFFFVSKMLMILRTFDHPFAFYKQISSS